MHKPSLDAAHCVSNGRRARAQLATRTKYPAPLCIYIYIHIHIHIYLPPPPPLHTTTMSVGSWNSAAQPEAEADLKFPPAESQTVPTNHRHFPLARALCRSASKRM